MADLSLHPVAKEFNYERNSPLRPEDFTTGSSKKIWWKCSKNHEHEWEALVKHRTKGVGCPLCPGKGRRKPSKENNLSLHPVAKEFHYERNAPLKPEDFTLKSNKKIWWKCSKNPDHEWSTSVKNRTGRGDNCPYCKGIGRRRSSKENNLSLHPVAKEFNYERNSPLTPEDFTIKSNKKVWWRCSKNPEHEWESTINNRTRLYGRGCSQCSNNGTSIKEQEVFDYIKSIYDGEIIHRYKLDGVEADIFIPEKNLAIEFNGLYWHSSANKPDNYHYTKYKHFEEKGIQLYYIWEDHWNFCREDVQENLRRLVFNNIEIFFKEETCYYTDFRFVSKFKKAGMVELHGYESWGLNGK